MKTKTYFRDFKFNVVSIEMMTSFILDRFTVNIVYIHDASCFYFFIVHFYFLFSSIVDRLVIFHTRPHKLVSLYIYHLVIIKVFFFFYMIRAKSQKKFCWK